jgi:hypothetical protein
MYRSFIGYVIGTDLVTAGKYQLYCLSSFYF